MMQRLAWCSISALLLLVACAAEEDQHLAPGSASCAALADHEIALCPAYGGERSSNIERCEEDRFEDELIGCEEDSARFVLCQTHATGYECEEGPSECYPELDELGRCRQRFAQATYCSRVPQDELCEGQSQPYSFSCIGDGPAVCGPSSRGQTEAEQLLGVGLRCCPSFASEGPSYFSDP